MNILGYSLMFIFPIILWVYILMFEYQKHKAGPCLLILCPKKGNETLQFVLGTVLILLALWQFNTTTYVESSLMFASSVGAFVIMWRKPQLHERGISTGFGFLNWEQIASYGWVDDLLLLSPKKPSILCWSAHLLIPKDKQKTAQDILSQYLGTQ